MPPISRRNSPAISLRTFTERTLNNPLRYTDPDGHCTNGQADDKGPCTPPAPKVDQAAFRQSLVSFTPKGTRDTVRTIAGIVAHETRGVQDKAGANEPLASAREKIAHVRINSERQYGDTVDQRARMATPQYTTPEFKLSLGAAINAAISDALGIDPTRGAIQYNMRTSMDQKGDFWGKACIRSRVRTSLQRRST